MNYRNLIFSATILFIFIAAKSDLQTVFSFKNFEKTLKKLLQKLIKNYMLQNMK
jgi:hypothetical protein